MWRSLLLLSVIGCSAPPPLVLASDPGGFSLALAPDTGAITLSRDGQQLLTLPPDGVQLGVVDAIDDKLSYDPYWLEYGSDEPRDPPPDLRWLRVAGVEVSRPAAGAPLVARLRFDDDRRATLTVSEDAAGRYRLQLAPEAAAGKPLAWLRLRARVSPTEGLYGMGGFPDEVNRRGQVYPMQIELAATESGTNEGHVPVPLVIGSAGWGLFVQSRRVGVFDLAKKEPDLIEVTYATADDPLAGLGFHLFAAAHPLDIPRRYYDVTGDPLLPAPWALGPWLWRNEARDQAQVIDDIAQVQARRLPTSGMWIDRPFATKVNTFDWEPGRFPDPQMMIDAARRAGLPMALWDAPYLEPGARGRDEALQKGYFPKKTGLILKDWGAPIDFTNPDAFAAWQDGIRRYTAQGIVGFKLDYGEDIAPGVNGVRNVWQFADGTDERTGHHDYPTLYHRAYAEVLAQAAPGGSYLLCRAGRYGDQTRASVIWPGDMDASFTRHRERLTTGGKSVIGVGGLPATVVEALSLSASGFPFFAADTGGYIHSPPGRELFVRWAQQTALSAVMNVGDASSQMPWEFTAANGRDDEALRIYQRYALLHMRLFPYEWTYAQRMKQTGRPILRPFGLQAPALGLHPSDEYFFGDDLLVAPVMTAGATQQKVILPAGDWVDFADGQVYSGGSGGTRVLVPAPLDKLPLLLRAGAIVPLLRPTILTMARATAPGVESFESDPGVLYAWIVPGPKAESFTLYDGTELRQAAAGRGLEVQPGEVFTRGVALEIYVKVAPTAILLDGAPLPGQATVEAALAGASGWAHDAGNGGRLWVKLPPGPHRVELQ